MSRSKRKPTKVPTHAVACPKGHIGTLELRCVVDVPLELRFAKDGTPSIAGVFTDPAAIDLADGDGAELGSDNGVWCAECERWYEEGACIHPTDDMGNPEIPSLGEAQGDEDADEDDDS